MILLGTGEFAKIGDGIGFKEDIEQVGTLVRVEDPYLILRVSDDHGGSREVRVFNGRRVWLEVSV